MKASLLIQILRVFFHNSVLNGLRAINVYQVKPLNRIKSASFTRPNNSDPYVANDVVGVSPAALMTFQNVVDVNGGSGWIPKIKIQINNILAAGASYRLHLFHTAPTAIADNAPYTLLYDNKDKRINFVDLTLQTEGSGSDSAWAVWDTPKKFRCADNSKDIYGILEIKSGRTPSPSEQHYVELHVDPD